MNSLCPICNAEKFKVVGNPKKNARSEKLVNEDYKIVQCSNCSTYYVNPRISFSNEEWAMLYNLDYFNNQSSWLKYRRQKELKQRFDKAEEYFHIEGLVNFLDIGCGEGNSLIEAEKRKWKTTGIDIVDNRISLAKSKNINFINGRFLELELPPSSFDFIYLDSVIEHILNPMEYLSKVKILLKEGGIVYIGVPNEDSLFNLIRKIIFVLIGRWSISVKIKPFDSPYHIIGFNKKSLIFSTNKIGFKIRKFRNFGRKFEFLGCSPTQKDFWINLIFLLPIEFIGKLFNKDVYYELYLSK